MNEQIDHQEHLLRLAQDMRIRPEFRRILYERAIAIRRHLFESVPLEGSHGIPQDDLDRIRNSRAFQYYLERLGPGAGVQKAHNGIRIGICPKHGKGEADYLKDRGKNVRYAHGYLHCWSRCGPYSIYEFVQLKENVSFRDAYKLLAELVAAE